MDDIDEKIIAILEENGRTSYTEVGKQIGLSEGAVRRRVKTLMNSGAIRKFTIQIGFEKGAKAILLLTTTPSIPTSNISETLIKIEGIKSVHEVTGEYDIAVFLSTSNIKEINHSIEEIRRIEGVKSTNTVIILRDWGSEY